MTGGASEAGRAMPDQPAQESPDTVELSATVERVVFHNPENGYTVLRLLPEHGMDTVAAVGHLLNPQAGLRLLLRGQWANDPRFGRQLRFSFCEERLPATTEAIRLYLSSGLIKGVGPAIANKIVARFGTETLRMLDENPDCLLEIPRISKKTVATIRESWTEHRGIRDLLLFLQPHGISPAYAARIYRFYGAEALAIIRENPYRMAMDIRGIGFVTADAAAAKLGFGQDHPLRAQAGVLYVLQKSSEDGHVYLPRSELMQAAEKFQIPPALIPDALRQLELEERIVREEMDGEEGIYLRRFHHCETKIAYYLHRLLHSPRSAHIPDADRLIRDVTARLPITLADEQMEAVRMATRTKVMVLTGGPGTGKTTIINAIIQIFADVRARVLLAAPTGRAAKRMAETSGREARTLHRLLEYRPQEDGFARNEDNPLACSLLVVDEASMMDTLLFYHLLKAVPLGATLLLVGDVRQLPSVGPGNVLGDIIASGVLPVVELTEIFRQSAASEIICNAHLINRGEVPRLESSKDRLSDFYFIRQNDPERVADLIVELVKTHIPRRFGLDPVNDIQVLTPMHRGAVGAGNLNARLQEALNPQPEHMKRMDRAFRLHDKVMQIRNNYEKDVYNGDVGRIILMDTRERTLTVRFDDRNVPYDFDTLDELVPAYAISIHKSQGSEYPAVVIPLMVQHFVMLQRNLVYTGITRGKKLVVLVGEPKALHMAVKNNSMRKRHTRLARRLMPAQDTPPAQHSGQAADGGSDGAS